MALQRPRTRPRSRPAPSRPTPAGDHGAPSPRRPPTGRPAARPAPGSSSNAGTASSKTMPTSGLSSTVGSCCSRRTFSLSSALSKGSISRSSFIASDATRTVTGSSRSGQSARTARTWVRGAKQKALDEAGDATPLPGGVGVGDGGDGGGVGSGVSGARSKSPAGSTSNASWLSKTRKLSSASTGLAWQMSASDVGTVILNAADATKQQNTLSALSSAMDVDRASELSAPGRAASAAGSAAEALAKAGELPRILGLLSGHSAPALFAGRGFRLRSARLSSRSTRRARPRARGGWTSTSGTGTAPPGTAGATSSSDAGLRRHPRRSRPPSQLSVPTDRNQDTYYTRYLVRLIEDASWRGRPRGGQPNPAPVRLPLPLRERRPLPPLALKLYCEAERLYVRREYEAALILFARGARLHPDSSRFVNGVWKTRHAIAGDIKKSTRLLLDEHGVPRPDAALDRSRSRSASRSRSRSRVGTESEVERGASPDPGCLAAEAVVKTRLGAAKLVRKNVMLGPLARLGRLGCSVNAQSQHEPRYGVPLQDTDEVLVGTLAEIAAFVQRREEYWRRLPVPSSEPPSARRPPAARNSVGAVPELWRQPGPPPAAPQGDGPRRTASSTASASTLPLDKRARVQLRNLEAAHRERRFGDVLELGGQLLRALEAARRHPIAQAERDAMIVSAQNYVTIAHMERKELEAAGRVAERMLRRARSLSDPRVHAAALATAGRLRAAAGQLGWAAACWEQMVPLVQDDETRAWLFHELGRCFFQLNELESARKYGQWSLAAARRVGSPRWALNAALLGAQTEMQAGNYASAHTFLAQARPFCAQLQDAAAAAYIRTAEQLILTDRLPTVRLDASPSRAGKESGDSAGDREKDEGEGAGAGPAEAKGQGQGQGDGEGVPATAPVDVAAGDAKGEAAGDATGEGKDAGEGKGKGEAGAERVPSPPPATPCADAAAVAAAVAAAAATPLPPSRPASGAK